MKQVLDGDTSSIKHRLANFLFKYRATPHTVTGVSPAELFLKIQLRTKLSLLKPDLGKRVSLQQDSQKRHHDKGPVRVRTFARNQSIRVRNFRGGKEKWLLGTVVKQLGPLTYLIRVGRTLRYVHVDHLLATGEESVELYDQPIASETEQPKLPMDQPFASEPDHPVTTQDLPPPVNDPPAVSVPSVPIPSVPKDVSEPKVTTPALIATPQPERRYPVRERRPPRKLDL
ncbi:uncharacterized protein [Argopecten irradians]|uniref:uncharacterized protein n=1 Tax=Argopecten irradians TaxID=31199 RepID=UPI00371E3AF0